MEKDTQAAAAERAITSPTVYAIHLDGWKLETCPVCGRPGVTDGTTYEHAAGTPCKVQEARR